MSTESSSQFLYVIDYNGSSPSASAIESFQIDAVNQRLSPCSAAAPCSSLLPPLQTGPVQLSGLFLSGATHPSGKSFYAFLTNPNGAVPNQAIFLVFDSATGQFTNPNANNASSSFGTFGCCFALDPQGSSLALGVSSQITVYSLQSDGTLAPNPSGTFVNGQVISMSYDSLGRFLYVDVFQAGAATPDLVHFLPLPTLQESSNSPLTSTFPLPKSWNVDPTAPLIYADQVYKVDPLTGIPSSILPSNPLLQPNPGSPRAVFSRPPGSQPIVGPIAQLIPSSLSFGSLSVGQTTSAQTLTIASMGGQALSLNTVAITGANSSDFSITGDTCHAPTVLQPGASCSVLVSFTPSATGNRSAALTITDNASPTTQSALLSGTGLAPAPAVTLIPGSLNFGTVTQGSSTPLNLSVTNSGTATLHITSIALGGLNPGDYSSSSPGCSSAIAVNSSCTVTVTFTPVASGVRSATLTITDDAPNSPQSVSLTGTATAPPSTKPAVALAPTALSFPATTQGTTNGPLSLTLTNSGAGTLHISSVLLGGANPSEFSMTNGCTAAAYAVNATCTISAVFAPANTGTRTATITITDDAPNSPQVVNLAGNANVAFTVGTVPGGSMTASVSAGQTAQYQLQLTPGPNFSGTVSLACSGAPLGATCQLPASVSLANGTATPFTVTVATSGPAVLPPSAPVRFRPTPGAPVLPLAVLALVLLVYWNRLRAFKRVTRSNRFAFYGVLAAAIFCVTVGLAGCGGGATLAPSPISPPPPVVTPSGTSTITISFTAASSTGQPLQLQPVPLTLTVK